MGSGRGDRNQIRAVYDYVIQPALLQWGPVVVTGIRGAEGELQRQGPDDASMGSGRGDRNQLDAEGEAIALAWR